jgi:hypothetical protein
MFVVSQPILSSHLSKKKKKSQPILSSWNKLKIDIILELLLNYYLFWNFIIMPDSIANIKHRFLNDYEGLIILVK